jgi:hypothetical protein
MALTPRWTPLRPHATQLAYRGSPHRFNVVPAGRRSGKTERAKRKLVARAIRGTDFYPARFFAAAPTRDQAKRIFWQDLKALVPPGMMLDKSEGELMIRLPLSEVWVVGMDRPERIEGQPWDGGILDEYANMKATAWGENVRPALADRRGWCDLIGVPEGRNHYYDLRNRAEADLMEFGSGSAWGLFEWVSADILPTAEIEAARRDLDELTFRQEYEASFVSFEGIAYHAFSDANKAKLRDRYRPDQTLVIALDFNVEPGVAVISQEMQLPAGQEGTGCIGEVYIERNSTTPAVCRKIISDWGGHQGRVEVYGDATGGARGTAQTEGSDWDLVKKILGAHFRKRLRLRVPRSNPTERARVNAMNSRLRSAEGTMRLQVDPRACPRLVRDFEGVQTLKGGSGEIDKKADPRLTHLTDGLGYYIQRRFPIVKRKAESLDSWRI